jgi:glycosyltransferase involved in cell wall biosynthesis
LRIAIDATGMSPYKTGTVTYLIEILHQWNLDRSIKHQFVIYCTAAARHHLDGLRLDNRFDIALAPNSKLVRMIWQQTVLPLLLWRHKVDVHWGTGFVLPVMSRCTAFVTIHDMTFDLFPQVHEPFKRLYFPFMIRRAVKRASKVFAVSHSTANDLTRLLGLDPRKILITPLAARQLGTSFIEGIGQPSCEDEQTRPVDSPYVLFVGTLEPRKNLKRLLQAWHGLDAKCRVDYRLVVVGVKGWMVDELETGDDESVDFVGHVSDEALSDYLQHATCFVYPSLYEGFGLPVMEAMAAGIPVLTSDVGATREIAQGAAVLVDPNSVQAINRGLLELLSSPELRQTLAGAGVRRAREFSWQRTAQLTLDGLSAVNESSDVV